MSKKAPDFKLHFNGLFVWFVCFFVGMDNPDLKDFYCKDNRGKDNHGWDYLGRITIVG